MRVKSVWLAALSVLPPRKEAAIGSRGHGAGRYTHFPTGPTGDCSPIRLPCRPSPRAQDGSSNWLKGVLLLLTYFFVAAGFWSHQDLQLSAEEQPAAMRLLL